MGHYILLIDSLVFHQVVSTFDDLGLKDDLLRGIYAYSTERLFNHNIAFPYVFSRL